jgi:hypothetical protein
MAGRSPPTVQMCHLPESNRLHAQQDPSEGPTTAENAWGSVPISRGTSQRATGPEGPQPLSSSVYPRRPRLSRTLPCSLQVAGGCSRIVGSCPIAAPEQALSDWDKANPTTVHDPLFRREILPKLASVKLSEIAEAAGLSEPHERDIRNVGKVRSAQPDFTCPR